jgi:hypothetical protein
MRETGENVAIAQFEEIIDEVSMGVQRLVSNVLSINIYELSARLWVIAGLKKRGRHTGFSPERSR